jgi:hypothetical protein
MTVRKSTSKRRLKPFEQMISKRYNDSKGWKTLGIALAEENDEMVITQSSSILIGNDASPIDRKQLIMGFAADIDKFEGEKIIAIAVALK